MVIKFLTSIAGPNFSFSPGELVEDSALDKDEVARWLNAGICEAVKDEAETPEGPKRGRPKKDSK